MKVQTTSYICDICGIDIKDNNTPINNNITFKKLPNTNICLRCGGILLDFAINDGFEVTEELLNKTKKHYQRNKDISFY